MAMPGRLFAFKKNTSTSLYTIRLGRGNTATNARVTFFVANPRVLWHGRRRIVKIWLYIQHLREERRFK
jgi:hypothetical protein